MKRLTVLVLCFVFMAVALLPGFAAASVDEGLQDAIVRAKTLFEVSEEFEFDYSMHESEGMPVWNLRWYSEDNSKGYLNVSIRDDGWVTDYNRYTPGRISGKKLPVISEEEAMDIAGKFLKKVNPDILKEIRFDKNNYEGNLQSYYYYLTYYRVKNGIPFYDDVVSVRINHQTGEVTRYSTNWTFNAEFESIEEEIGVKEAIRKYKENLGIEMVYRLRWESDEPVITPVYTTKFSNSSYFIDAFTGETVKLRDEIRITLEEASMEKQAVRVAAGDSGVTLSPAELDALEESSGLMTLDDAEKEARSLSVLELTDEYELTGSYLSKDWRDQKKILWSLNFRKQIEENNKNFFTAVTIDALTGEIIRFNRNVDYNDDAEITLNRAAALEKAKLFLDDFAPERYEDVEIVDWYSQDSINQGDTLPRTQNFAFARIVNGIPFLDNGISVTIDAAKGSVVNYNLSWNDGELPSVENAKDKDLIYEKLFEDTELELRYKKMNVFEIMLTGDGDTASSLIRAVYALEPSDTYSYNALTGERAYSNGAEYVENATIEYEDIDETYAKDEVLTLAKYGIAFEGSMLNPKDAVTQKEFIELFLNAIDGYYGPYPLKTESDIKYMWSFLNERDIIGDDEWNPDDSVTREECVKYVVRALGYREVAEIDGIFISEFEDEDQISDGMLGYVAIANGLGIVRGSSGIFNPNGILTREQAIIIIYNYLR